MLSEKAAPTAYRRGPSRMLAKKPSSARSFPFLASSLSSQLMHQQSWKSSALPAEPLLPSVCFLSLPPDGLKRLMEKSDFTPDGESRYFRDFSLRSDRSSVVPASICPELHAAIKMENEVLGAIIPGLSLELKELNEETLDDGKTGKRFELLSRRGDIYVPFHCESEDVKKIVSILGRLVDVYSDENVCLVIDELDSESPNSSSARFSK